MSCVDVCDFLSYPTIRFPSAPVRRSGEQEDWDILRANRQADALVAKHLKALNALNKQKIPTARNH